MDTGYNVTLPIDRDYFWSIYRHAPDAVLFEMVTIESGPGRVEGTADLGEALKIPLRHTLA